MEKGNQLFKIIAQRVLAFLLCVASILFISYGFTWGITLEQNPRQWPDFVQVIYTGINAALYIMMGVLIFRGR